MVKRDLYMLLSLKEISFQDERFFKSFTGVGWSRYQKLRAVFSEQYAQYHEKTIVSPSKRKRVKGGGRKPKLPTIDDKLVFTLHYFKSYPTFDNLASTFGMSRGSAHGLLHSYSKVLKSSLDHLDVLPKRKLNDQEELLSFLKSLDADIDTLLVDVTERPYRRLCNKDERDALYSGKKSDLPSKIQS
jgi:hypothetical protein